MQITLSFYPLLNSGLLVFSWRKSKALHTYFFHELIKNLAESITLFFQKLCRALYS